jgi:hypothetical protein
MHIEPGVVDGAKILLSYGTAAAALGLGARLAWQAAQKEGVLSVLLRAVIASVLVFGFFEVLPHEPVGVSEVHLIMGTTLLLILGVGPAALGLTAGLAIQGLFFAPADLPQFGMNVTTLLVPLFATAVLAKRIVAPNVAYVDLSYRQALKLSAAYQGGIVVWVGFWALYGNGFAASNLVEIAQFGGAYMTVVLLEPLVDMGVLAAAKLLHNLKGSPVVEPRLYSAA